MNFPPVKEQLDEIQRETLEIVPVEALERKLERSLKTGTPLVVKQGFDPTRPDLHIGHAVSLRKLRAFQELGHDVVFVMGGYTAMIGDPTGRSDLRPPLTEEEVEANGRTYAEQMFKILDPGRTRIENNAQWLKPLQLKDILSITSKYTVARMLERDDFHKRYAEGRPISIVEFMYPLMQAYDSVVLKADVELGGNDQKFNLLVARDLQERFGQEPQVCLLMPLLRGTDGVHKMSKSYDNYVGVSDAPDQQYGRTMSIPDDLLEEWYRLASGLSGDALDEAVASAKAEPYRAKRRLASLIVDTYHGPGAGEGASEHFDSLFKRREIPDEMPEFELSATDAELGVQDGTVAVAKLLVRTGLVTSGGDAQRQIQQGAVSVDGEKVADRMARIPASGEVVLQRGKRHFARVRFV
ncbi:MAG TPA: tyrosine--tRNA ligase [Longimicrobium sp.]|nr:tyrosine--tRNA ligase [Longimicrobium sp.]